MKLWLKCARPSNILDKYTFVIALTVISVFLLYFGIMIFIDGAPDYNGLKTVSATLGNIVAAIIGYYFGQRPVARLAKEAEMAASDRDKFKRDSVENLENFEIKTQKVEDYGKQVADMNQQMNDLRQKIENIKSGGA
jgi:hypothetical protein